MLCPTYLWGGKLDPPSLSSYEERNKNGPVRSYLTSEKMCMNSKNLIAVTIALTVCAFAGSNVTAHGGGGGVRSNEGVRITSPVALENPAYAP